MEMGGLNRNTSDFYQPIIIDNPDSLNKIFQIGAREIGLKIDKIAFGLSSYYYTVDNLNKSEAAHWNRLLNLSNL